MLAARLVMLLLLRPQLGPPLLPLTQLGSLGTFPDAFCAMVNEVGRCRTGRNDGIGRKCRMSSGGHVRGGELVSNTAAGAAITDAYNYCFLTALL